MNFIITYDVQNDKRRKKISDELEAYGIRVNYSVFECQLNKTKLKKLKQKLEELVNKKEDSLRCYHICQSCIPKSFEICNKADIFEPLELFI